MGRKRHGAEQIIAKLREAEVELARGKTAGEVCHKLGITEQTYCSPGARAFRTDGRGRPAYQLPHAARAQPHARDPVSPDDAREDRTLSPL